MSDSIERIGGVGTYTEFLGAPEDEELAGHIYDALPRFPSHNLVNRKEAVRVIASALRTTRDEAGREKEALKEKLRNAVEDYTVGDISSDRFCFLVKQALLEKGQA